MDDFFKDNQFQFLDLLRYYSNQFIKRADLLLPLALLIASIKVLSTLNTRREWMVLQVAGLKNRRLLRPFFAVAMFCSLFNLANFEFFLPKALAEIDEFHATHFKHSHRAQRKELIHLLSLKDNSKLIYQSFDASKGALFDVLWVRSADDIWRMKFLNANPNEPIAEYVDHLTRNNQGFLEKSESHDFYRFKDLKWQPTMTGNSFVPFENRSLKELYHLAFCSTTTTSYEYPKIITQLCFKCSIPLLAFAVVAAVAPACLAFSRQLNLFLVYALGLLGLLACYMIMDSMVTLGENSIISPLIAVFAPLTIIGTISTWKFLQKI